MTKMGCLHHSTRCPKCHGSGRKDFVDQPQAQQDDAVKQRHENRFYVRCHDEKSGLRSDYRAFSVNLTEMSTKGDCAVVEYPEQWVLRLDDGGVCIPVDVIDWPTGAESVLVQFADPDVCRVYVGAIDVLEFKHDPLKALDTDSDDTSDEENKS